MEAFQVATFAAIVRDSLADPQVLLLGLDVPQAAPGGRDKPFYDVREIPTGSLFTQLQQLGKNLLRVAGKSKAESIRRRAESWGVGMMFLNMARLPAQSRVWCCRAVASCGFRRW